MADVPCTPDNAGCSTAAPDDGADAPNAAGAVAPSAANSSVPPAAIPASGARQFPPGLLSEDTSIPRTAWPEEQELVSCSTWSTDNRLKLGEKEYEAIAAKAEEITALAKAQYPKGDLTGVAAMKQYDKRCAAANKLHLRLGCRGKPVFAKLSYHR